MIAVIVVAGIVTALAGIVAGEIVRSSRSTPALRPAVIPVENRASRAVHGERPR